MASSPIVTRVVFTFADWSTTVLSIVSWGAGARIVINSILAGSTIQTRKGGTVIHIIITVSSSKTSLALAYVGISEINTLGSISTRIGAAIINFLFTVKPRVTQWAATAVSTIRVVCASPSIEAWAISASHSTQLTVFTIEARWTGTGIAVFKIGAASTILAGVGITFVDFNLTVGTSVPRTARTSVASLASIGTSGTILARLMMGTVIKILVTEKATPAFLTVALPWLLASTMKAAWISDALITITPLPPNPTFAFSRFVTKPMLFITSRQANWFGAVLALPAWVADLLSTLSASEVAKGIIPGPAEDRAAFSIVVFITHKAVGVLEVRAATAVQVLGPLFPHCQMPLCGQPTDKALWVLCVEVIGRICMKSFNDERESAGPGEAEGEADGVAEGGLGAAGAVGHAEGVGAQHRGDGAAVGAGRLGGYAGLIVLEAHAEEGLAVALLQPGAGAAAPRAAAVAVPQQPLLIDKLLQLQLEHPGAAHLAMAKQHREDGKSQHGLTSHFGESGFSSCPFSFLSFFHRQKKKSVSQEA